MISRFFIDRPVFACVISIVIVIAGLLAIKVLPVEQYPDLTPPVVSVTTNYPGANSEIVSQNVAAPIELQINGVENMLYMTSSCAQNGDLKLNVIFDIGTDPDIAQVMVQNRVDLVLPQLPAAVIQQGVQVQKVSSTTLMIIAVYCTNGRYDEAYVDNYANLYILDTLKRIPGASQTAMLGMGDYAMRVWLRPDQMSQLGVTASDVANAIRRQNQQFAIGQLGQPPMKGKSQQTLPITTRGMMTDPEEFKQIIIKTSKDGSAILRLRDIGTVELGLRDYRNRTRLNGRPATLIAVYQEPGANALEVSKNVIRTLNELKKTFPQGIDYQVSLDVTRFVSASIREVAMTLAIAIALVIMVVYLFLGSFRATLVPVLAIPVSIIGTFAGLKLAGFSINMLSLFAMILSTGIVVDDAIVVTENIERNMREKGVDPKAAAKMSMDEVTGPVIAIVLVLVAVFVPVAFLSGMVGQLYKQFAITIAISVVISGIVALTLSPAVAAMILKNNPHQRRGFFKWFNKSFERFTGFYIRGVRFSLRRKAVMIALFIIISAAAYFLMNAAPSGFIPDEDQGYLFGVTLLPDIASLDRVEELDRIGGKIFASHKAVENVIEVDGYNIIDDSDKNNSGSFFVTLKDFSKRKSPDMSSDAVSDYSAERMSEIIDGIMFPVSAPPVEGLSTVGGLEFWVQNRNEGGAAQLGPVIEDLVAKASKRKELDGVSTTFNANSQQLFVKVNADRAEMLGVPVEQVYETMQMFFSPYYVNQFTRESRLWYVILQAEPWYRKKPTDISNIYVRSTKGAMVPLKALVEMKHAKGPDLLTRFNNFPAARINFGPADGYSTGQAIKVMEETARASLAPGFTFDWSGIGYETKKSGSASITAFIFGLVMAFLILAAQYERWSLPLGVLLAVPFALFGAVLAILIRGTENDIYFQIGLLTLIALSAKNAILIFEFAVMKKRQGMSAVEAVIEASRLRIRPIMMTSLAFILGCLPLALATGASENSRHSIGTGVIGGMLAASLVSIFFIPVFFVLVEKISVLGKSESNIQTDQTPHDKN